MKTLVNLYLSDRCDMYGSLAPDDVVEDYDYDSEWSSFDDFDKYYPAPDDIIRRLP